MCAGQLPVGIDPATRTQACRSPECWHLFNPVSARGDLHEEVTVFDRHRVSVLLTGVGLAAAQTTTTTTTQWTPDQGTAITTYSTTQKYTSFSDPNLTPTVGMVLPGTVTVYPLPSTVVVQSPDRYSYGIINDHTVVVDRSSR
jgi:Protein of unknown function (DUF1236)